MATFNDNFDRANGALGGNWTANGANVQIANGIVLNTTNANWAAYNSGVGGAGRQEARATVVGSPTASYHAGVLVKADTGLASAYAAFVTYLAGTWTFRLRVGAIRGGSDLDTATTTTSPPGQYTVTIVWDEGELTATCPGFDTLTATDWSLVANGSLGINGVYNQHAVNSCTLIAGNQPALDVTPTIIGNYGTPTELTFVGTSTDWTSGTPGTPTFTCDHGTLANQEITDTTHATADFDPGDFLGIVTFTDPSTGATDQITVTSDVGVVPPTGGALPADILAYLQRSADAEEDSVIANRNMDIATSGPSITFQAGVSSIRLSVSDTSITGHEVPDDTTIPALLVLLWDLVNDRADLAIGPFEPASGIPLMQQLDMVRAAHATLIGEPEYTLEEVIASIKGLDNRSVTQVYDLIDNLQAGSNQDVLDALAAYFGQNPPTIQQIGEMISAIATVAGYTLGDVLDEIDATQTAVASVGTAVSTMNTTLTNGLQAILDAIAAIEPGAGTPSAPLWPGISGVTLGEPVALAQSLDLEGPCDGILVDVTGVDTGVSWYTYHDVKAYRAVGALAFYTDRGDIEAFQTLGFEQAIYTPKTMRSAGGVKLFTSHGLSGTVRTWTIS